jgi:hypothetical protein
MGYFSLAYYLWPLLPLDSEYNTNILIEACCCRRVGEYVSADGPFEPDDVLTLLANDTDGADRYHIGLDTSFSCTFWALSNR